jgi:hypothetical protein
MDLFVIMKFYPYILVFNERTFMYHLAVTESANSFELMLPAASTDY